MVSKCVRIEMLCVCLCIKLINSKRNCIHLKIRLAVFSIFVNEKTELFDLNQIVLFKTISSVFYFFVYFYVFIHLYVIFTFSFMENYGHQTVCYLKERQFLLWIQLATNTVQTSCSYLEKNERDFEGA